MSTFTKTFMQEPEDAHFSAYHDADAWLSSHGFSLGRGQAHAPTGILFGDFDIQKWRNLSRDDRAALHGELKGDHRVGPLTVTLYSRAPPEAVRAALANPVVMAGARAA